MFVSFEVIHIDKTSKQPDNNKNQVIDERRWRSVLLARCPRCLAAPGTKLKPMQCKSAENS